MLTRSEAVALELLIGGCGLDFEVNVCSAYIGKKLAARGLVRRLPPCRIGRLTQVEVTDAGRKAWDAHNNVRLREATDVQSAQ